MPFTADQMMHRAVQEDRAALNATTPEARTIHQQLAAVLRGNAQAAHPPRPRRTP